MTPLILGTAQLVTDYGDSRTTPALTFDEAVEMVQLAEELGYAGIDTAYRYGAAERVIGVAQVKLPVYTKLDPHLYPAESLYCSLSRLGRDHFDGVFLHDPMLVISDPHRVIDQARGFVGKEIGFLGASVYTPAQIEAAVSDERITAIQIPYEELPIDSKGKQVFIRSVLGRGKFSHFKGTLIKQARDELGLAGMVIGIDNKDQLLDTFNIWNTP